MSEPASQDIALLLRSAFEAFTERPALKEYSRDGTERTLTYGDLRRAAERATSRQSNAYLDSLICIDGDTSVASIVELVGALSRARSVALMSYDDSRRLLALPAGAIVFHTSGTRAAPVAIVHTQRSIANSVRRTPLVGFASEQVGFVVPIGISHIGGVFTTLRALSSGGCLVVPTSAHPRDIVVALNRSGAQIVGVPPALARLIARARLPPGLDTSRLVLNLATMGASADLVADLRERLGCTIAVSYGSTELGGPVTVGLLDEMASPGYAGTPLEGVDLRVERAHGSECSVNELGQLFCRADQLFVAYGYEDRPTRRSDGYFATGDAASIDEHGGLRVLCRMDDVIVRSGRRLSPEAIEVVLERHPSIVEAAVIAVPGRRDDTRLVAFVVALPGQRAPDARDIRRHCAEALPASMCPERFVVLSHLPRTSNGKVRRAALREGQRSP